MKNKKYMASILVLILVLIFSGCGGPQTPSKEKINKLFTKVNLSTKKDDAIFYVDNKKDINRVNNIKNDIQSLLSENKFQVKYNCTFDNKKNQSSYINGIYVHFDGDYVLNKCEKIDKPKFFNNSNFVVNEHSFVLNKNLSDIEILNVYINFLMFLNEVNIEEELTIASKYNFPITLKLDNKSFKENRLIMNDSFLEKMSVKSKLIEQLKSSGYKVTNEIDKSNIIIEVENFAITNNNYATDDIKRLVLVDSRKGSTNYTPSGNAGVFDIVILGLGALQILSDINTSNFVDTMLYTVNKCKIIEGNNVHERYMNTYVHKKYTTNLMSYAGLDIINSNVSNNLVMYRFVHVDDSKKIVSK
jgi:hypothetical protein